jgi:hypothetical protein
MRGEGNLIYFKSNYAEVDDSIRSIISAFRKLPPAVAKKRITQGMRKAIKPFLPVLQAHTPYKTGGLMRSAISKVKFYNKSDHGAVVGIIGYSRKPIRKRRGMFSLEGAGFHSHLVEYGTTNRKRSSGGSTGTMPAKRMLEQTLQSQKGLILFAIEQELAKSLEKAAEDLRKK